MKWSHISLIAAILLCLGFVGGSNSSASSFWQTPSPTTFQPAAKPILLTAPVPDPKQQGVMWFAPTGHTLRGPFLDYWQKNGGLAQFGYPITEEFTEPGPDGKPLAVQYFERNRFEHHPENRLPDRVLLGLLGTSFHAPDPASAPIAGAQYFPETGHNLSGAFRKYWDTHGRLAIHGYPITEQFVETNPIDHKPYTVQYFQRSRTELHPVNAGSPYEVLLGMLGTQLSRQKGYPYGRYPLYGHASDYSWFAGYYKADFRRCRGCGCSTVRFVNPSDTTYPSVGEVWPYLQDQQDRMSLDVQGLTATTDPQTFIVVFGQLDDPDRTSDGNEIESCLSPRFKVTSLQFNPAR
ncbi:MAG TPA: hypothetical protein VEW94_09165 [Chloroflexia bacterium]|nr:hypothetical protein [Chloroflexia bacterium]